MTHTELHPLIEAAAHRISISRTHVLPPAARLELERGLRALEESSELPWCLDSLTILAHRVHRAGSTSDARALIAIALRSTPALARSPAERTLRRFTACAAALHRFDPKRPVTQPQGGAPAWKLDGVATLRRRA